MAGKEARGRRWTQKVVGTARAGARIGRAKELEREAVVALAVGRHRPAAPMLRVEECDEPIDGMTQHHDEGHIRRHGRRQQWHRMELGRWHELAVAQALEASAARLGSGRRCAQCSGEARGKEQFSVCCSRRRRLVGGAESAKLRECLPQQAA